MSIVVVGVGSNLGAREASIRCALRLLDARDRIDVREVSTIYETEPLGPPQPRYLNAAFRLETTLSPLELLRVLLRTERRLGRHRVPDERWGPRSIDLDLLWDQRGRHQTSELSVPHPELENRGFALAPLLDVAPELDDMYGPPLRQLGGRPPAWGRESIVRAWPSAGGFEVDAEADSLVDACALCVEHLPSSGRPWSTRHAIIEPSAESFLIALRDLLRTGFSVHGATVSHCSKSQWALELHGANTGITVDADVRLRTTLGAKRQARVQLSLVVPGA
ncbi:MAG: 2-amino-4-hydroxy-6-hydroxymethyldihydropteridine diphosphokinase [Deltaproteobacteria bacterium]|nr:2-amino-4-hydroxy-6-hydroxymethyldihydropteridine diphosphokinase [Deltaproteobacteria bacterium]MBW1904168.1 2-amino-4-hydroxy-6-hydroxymethyldihydropteridine diphosphokinase [Deltaproteobacteria bacterium]MBW2551828.1 2-amino-4-hydroxy-6-hydroxymethyldihydropteridine diphosphokinase [Deltaproteobacteria bacterium]